MSVRSFAISLLLTSVIIAGFFGFCHLMRRIGDRRAQQWQEATAGADASVGQDRATATEDPTASHRAQLDSKSPGPEWLWLVEPYPPRSPTNEVRSLAYHRRDTRTLILAYVMDWEHREPATFAEADLQSWKEVYKDAIFTPVTVSEDGKIARFSFSHRSGHAEGMPGGCYTLMAYIRLPEVNGLVRVTSEGLTDADRQASETAFATIVSTIEAKSLFQ